MGGFQDLETNSEVQKLSLGYEGYIALLRKLGVGIRNNNKRKESTRVREVCSNCQFFWLSRCIST